MLAWIDLETTGLNPETCKILEVGLVVTDNDLSEVASASWVLPFPGLDVDAIGYEIDPFVREIHTKNGLWQECQAVEDARRAPDCYVRERASEAILALLRKYTSAKEGPICGSTVAFDRGFLRRHMPSVEAHFSHRNLDVSVLGELAKLWAPEVYEKRPKAGGHRALPDIRSSVELLRYWRQHLSEVLR